MQRYPEDLAGTLKFDLDHKVRGYRGTSLIRNSLPLRTYSSICLGPYGCSRGRGGSYERGTVVGDIGVQGCECRFCFGFKGLNGLT